MVTSNITNNTTDYTRLKSVMAERPHDKVSDRYNFIPTVQVINLLEKHGWYVSSARETNAREGRQGFQKHMLRFRQKGDVGRTLLMDELIPEILMANAHDTSAAFLLMSAFERCWCTNQCTVADSTIDSHRILHKGYQDEQILEAVYHIVEDTPKVIESVERFKAIPLTNEEQGIFGESAIEILNPLSKDGEELFEKYDKETSINRLMKPKRKQDVEKNLWNTYNIVQEKFLKGDRFMVDKDAITNYYDVEMGKKWAKAKKTKQVKSIDKDIRLNKALWTLTEAMANLKGA